MGILARQPKNDSRMVQISIPTIIMMAISCSHVPFVLHITYFTSFVFLACLKILINMVQFIILQKASWKTKGNFHCLPKIHLQLNIFLGNSLLLVGRL